MKADAECMFLLGRGGILYLHGCTTIATQEQCNKFSLRGDLTQ